MFCGSAAGQMLPPMVVYRAQNLYTSWCERGPKGTVYSCSKSGWFDMYQFEMWFCKLLLPRLKRLPGKKLILGDNLSSHISIYVIDLCKANDIRFVCLPPNSTDKLQPLDVGVFGPMKAAWRTVLTEYKRKNPKVVGIQKTDFPSLLASMLEKADPGKHLPAAFDRCGLYPLNPERGMERIPSRHMATDKDTTTALLDSTLGEMLEELRGVGNIEKKKRGKKLKVPPGKSFCKDTDSEDSDDMALEEGKDRDEVEENNVEMEDDEIEQLLGGGDRRAKRMAKRMRASVETSEEDEEMEDDPKEQPLRRRASGRTRRMRVFEDTADEEEEEEDEDDEGEFAGGEPCKTPPLYAVGSYVAAVYDHEWYVAQVEAEEPENECQGFTLLKYMERKGKNQFVWGEKKDTLKTINRDILRKVDPPIPVSSRLWGLPKEIEKEIDKLMRVKWSIIDFHYHTNIIFFPPFKTVLSYLTFLS